MTHKKFGLRQVRVPRGVLDELHSEHFITSNDRPFYYRVDRLTGRGLRYVAYRCNKSGDRLRGATKYPFDPIRYARRPRPAPTAPVHGSGDADHGNTGGLPPTSTDAAQRSSDEPVPGGQGCGDGYRV